MALIVIAGRFVKDGELRITPSGAKVLLSTIAENTYVSNQKHTQYFDFVIFGNRAESLHNYVKKGTYATIFGQLQVTEYTSAEGLKRKKNRVIANDIVLQGAIRNYLEAPPSFTQTTTQNELTDEDIPF